ncbi:hypothetical protein J6590_081433 [Homalodisca vitripennis]|nr:hypothetical protein J6590_081433 [Homalodisca vitripennis]
MDVAVVEFDAFKDNDNRFIVKEFVIISHLFRAHMVFKPPYDKGKLNSKMARTARWLERHFHNIKWEEVGSSTTKGLYELCVNPLSLYILRAIVSIVKTAPPHQDLGAFPPEYFINEIGISCCGSYQFLLIESALQNITSYVL